MLPYNNLRKLMPLIEDADRVFDQEMYDSKDEHELVAAVAKYNAVLEKAIYAWWEDTNYVNRLETLDIVSRSKSPYDTHFSINPVAFLRKLTGYTENAS